MKILFMRIKIRAASNPTGPEINLNGDMEIAEEVEAEAGEDLDVEIVTTVITEVTSSRTMQTFPRRNLNHLLLRPFRQLSRRSRLLMGHK